MRAILSCSAAIMLAGCGGGLSQLESQAMQFVQANNPNPDVPVNQAQEDENFANGAGVDGYLFDNSVSGGAVADGATGRQTMVILAHDIADIRASMPSSFVVDFMAWVDANQDYQEDFGDAVVSEVVGVNDFDGLNGTVGYLKMKDYEGYAAYFKEDNGDMNVAVFGPEVAGLPTGTHTYKGKHIVGETEIVGEFDSDLAMGDMELIVDFTNGRGNLETTNTLNLVDPAPTGGLEVLGDITIDLENGTFSGNQLHIAPNTTFTANPWAAFDGETASISGNFHGSGGKIVTGMWYQNTENNAMPEIGGAIIGQAE